MSTIDPSNAAGSAVLSVLLPILNALLSNYKWPQWAKDTLLNALAVLLAGVVTHLQQGGNYWVSLGISLLTAHVLDAPLRAIGLNALEKATTPTMIRFGLPPEEPEPSMHRYVPAPVLGESAPPRGGSGVRSEPAPVPAPLAPSAGEKTAVLIEDILAEAERQRQALEAQQKAAVDLQNKLAHLLAAQKGGG